MDIVLLVGLISLNGVLAMSEIALVAAKSSRLKKQAEHSSLARTALRLKQSPTQFLSTIQIGITAIGILSGIVGEANFSQPLAQYLSTHGLPLEIAQPMATALVVISITYFTIVVGELVPKRCAQNNAERIAVVVAYPIHLLAKLFAPFVWLLSASTDTLLNLLRQQNQDSDIITEEDIVAVVTEGSASGAIEPQEQTMIRNLLHLNDRMASSLMTPRSDIDYLDLTHPIEKTLKRLCHTQHSVWPVCRGGLDNLIGTISSKVLLDQHPYLSVRTIAEYSNRPRYMLESIKGLTLLNEMQSSNSEMAFIVDEYGDVQGLVTYHDVLKSIAGELGCAPQYSWAKKDLDGNWIMDALIPVHELKHRLHQEVLEGESIEGFQTLNGFLTWKVGKVPRQGEVINYNGWRFEVLAVTHNRILQVRVGKLSA
ncbi:hemolysin family protein [Vibrio paucivorans]